MTKGQSHTIHTRLLLRRNITRSGTGFALVTGTLLLANIFLWCALREPISLALWWSFRIPLVGYIYSDVPQAQLMVGTGYFGLGGYDPERAKYWFQRAVAADKDYATAHWWLARVYFIENRLDLAGYHADRAVILAPESPQTYYLRGLIRGYNGNTTLAIQDFTKYIQMFPSMWAGYNDLAWLYFKTGDYKKVRDIAKEGLEKTRYPYGENPWLLNSYGIAEMNLGNTELARDALERALTAAKEMTPERWGAAYPGNDPAEYAIGLAAFRRSIEENLALNEKGEKPVVKPAPPL